MDVNCPPCIEEVFSGQSTKLTCHQWTIQRAVIHLNVGGIFSHNVTTVWMEMVYKRIPEDVALGEPLDKSRH